MKKDPQYFTPDDIKTDRDPPDPASAVYMDDLHTWASPSMICPVNSRVVRRSGAVLHYGDKFTYTEMVMNSNWMSAKLSSSKLTVSGGVRHGELIDPVKEFKNHEYEMKFYAKCGRSRNKFVVCTVSGKGEPIYDITSKIMIEAGILLCKFHDTLPIEGKDAYGFHTPATALGIPLRERLKSFVKMSFDIDVKLIDNK